MHVHSYCYSFKCLRIKIVQIVFVKSKVAEFFRSLKGYNILCLFTLTKWNNILTKQNLHKSTDNKTGGSNRAKH